MHDLGRVKGALSPTLDDESVDRLWTGIATRRQTVARQRRAVATGSVVGAALVAAVLVAGRPALRGELSTAGPLRMRDGAELGVLASGDRAQPFALSDSSIIELDRGGRLETRSNSGAVFTAHLVGAATFEVTPGGPRRWSIECGPVTVDVIGTRFVVAEERNAAARWVRVRVEHGVVLVRGEAVPDHVRRLVDGQSIDVPEGDALAPPASPVTPSPEAVPVVPPTPVPGQPQTPRPHAPTWHDLARGGDYDRAYRELGPSGLAAEASRAGVEDLLSLADVARLSAHPRDAVAPLSRVIDDHGDDPRAPLAAFTLGRLELDTLSEPRSAAAAFQRAIRLGLPEGLVEDAYARLVEAHSRGGDLAVARAARDEYLRRYPQGTRLGTMARWVAGD